MSRSINRNIPLIRLQHLDDVYVRSFHTFQMTNLLAGFNSATILNQFCISANFMSLLVLRAVKL